MIPSGVQVFVALGPVDMRYGVKRLSGVVREQMGYEPRGGALLVLVGRRRQLVNDPSLGPPGSIAADDEFLCVVDPAVGLVRLSN